MVNPWSTRWSTHSQPIVNPSSTRFNHRSSRFNHRSSWFNQWSTRSIATKCLTEWSVLLRLEDRLDACVAHHSMQPYSTSSQPQFNPSSTHRQPQFNPSSTHRRPIVNGGAVVVCALVSQHRSCRSVGSICGLASDGCKLVKKNTSGCVRALPFRGSCASNV
jgi:hypothetical protein